MRILVTNDDGVDSPGIHALAAALVADGHDVFVVAPTDDRSGAGASIGRMIGGGPPPVERRVWDELPDLPVHAIDAPPAMAVFATCLGAFGDLPDLIASGINPGANTGHLVLHSGTVGATLTGAGLRHPRASRCRSTGASSSEYHWDAAARIAASAVEWVGQARRRRARPQHQRAQPARSPRSRASARPSSRPRARCGWRRPTCRRATSRSRSPVGPTPRPAPTSRSCTTATCRSRR